MYDKSNQYCKSIINQLKISNCLKTNKQKSKDITLLPKLHVVKAMVFPVDKYRCDSWTIKKAEHQRINAFEMWCWRRLLWIPWKARRSNQSTLNTLQKDWCCSLSSNNWSPEAISWLIGKVPDSGKDWRQKEKRVTEDEMFGWHHWFTGHEFGQIPGNDEGQRSQAQLGDWTTRKICWL